MTKPIDVETGEPIFTEHGVEVDFHLKCSGCGERIVGRLGVQVAAAEEERAACAKILRDRAAEFRAQQFPHIHEEKAQLMDYAASLILKR